MHPGITAPALVSRFSGTRDRVKTPDFFTGFHIPGSDESANAELSAGSARDDLVLHDERRVRERVSLLRIASRLGLPELTTVAGVDGDDSRVE
jgi:hypothetical protein